MLLSETQQNNRLYWLHKFILVFFKIIILLNRSIRFTLSMIFICSAGAKIAQNRFVHSEKMLRR
ncbi:hypothetical protein LEP1GSC166_0236 [Leptospira kirschneri]|nr:hypothetical protein LEP1GSC198_3521 [Leptospira kirschneri str. JB]EMK08405.1 hypothetical protein LEP1GSC166_0236 [Leptospira kirschneri]